MLGPAPYHGNTCGHKRSVAVFDIMQTNRLTLDRDSTAYECSTLYTAVFNRCAGVPGHHLGIQFFAGCFIADKILPHVYRGFTNRASVSPPSRTDSSYGIKRLALGQLPLQLSEAVIFPVRDYTKFVRVLVFPS